MLRNMFSLFFVLKICAKTKNPLSLRLECSMPSCQRNSLHTAYFLSLTPITIKQSSKNISYHGRTAYQRLHRQGSGLVG